MDIGLGAADMRGPTEQAGDKTNQEFVYEAGRTLHVMPFTDAEEELAWDRAAEAMRK